MSVDPRQDILRESATFDSNGAVDDRLVQRYFEHVTDEDLRAIGSHTMGGLLAAHLRLAHHRPPGRSNIQLLHPTVEADGWTSSYPVLQIVTDDMPFLLDSVLAELGRRERAVHWIIHPQLWVRRDATGLLQEVLDADAPPVTHDGLAPMPESWMHLAIDLADDEAVDADLVSALHEVLGDVRDAVEDWPRMRSRCDQLIAELDRTPPPSVPAEIVARTQGFLRWLADEHFTFLGYREYDLETLDGENVLRGVPGTGLGVMRYDPATTVSHLTPKAQATAREPNLLTITKANSRSTVHRPVYLDYIGLRKFDADGHVVGEHRFLGLFSASAYIESIHNVPVLRERAAKILARSGYSRDSHSGKDLLEILETYPRDEFFQSSSEEVARVAEQVHRLHERRQAHVFRRDDEFGRFVSIIVYLPRDRYNTEVRLDMERVLRRTFSPAAVDFTTRVVDSPLARIHFVVRMPKGAPIPEVDDEVLSAQLLDKTQTWSERMTDAALAEDGEDAAARVASLYGNAFPAAYKEDFSPRQAVADLRHVEALTDTSDTRLTLYRNGKDLKDRRFKLFRAEPLLLTDVLPVFTDLGVRVTDERPYTINRSDGLPVHIYDFGLRPDDPAVWRQGDGAGKVRERFQEAFAAVWSGRCESDGLNALVLAAGLSWHQVAVLRMLARYLRQVGLPFSQEYVEQALVANVELTVLLVRLFEARHDPTVAADRDALQTGILEQIEDGLGQVASLDQDRIIRAFQGTITATLRTNAYVVREDGSHPAVISIKVDCAQVPGMPYPRPMFEIWVYSPRVEGVHLRFGKVARGGLRWSDRREDFRTEILGLVKAQMVKNAVIVPTGSKGGFYAKSLPDPGDREAWQAEGVAAYKLFISGLLDLTDNLVDGSTVVPAPGVVRHDGDDTYLVVAADKGTATFSDIANQVAQSYGFWLDDAFASGGSAGYDHKAMGITARGAWESVKRHFREIDVDTQSQDFTVIGVGDMSGDVFGNGMLLSQHIRLVAAFDHRHIFVDPAPDAATSYAERKRLFELPRSSWADYDEALISEGGGVFPRTAKSIPVSDQVREVLGLPETTTRMTPAELMHAILQAPVDLFWLGGIGTYVKAESESNTSIGDRANDAIRVNGNQLRCKVVGEGGNLGVSQLGRIEAAQHGVQLNTDAIDNSAGVDTSDHEVNIKILATGLVHRGVIDLPARNALLESMTDEIAEQVLRDNYEQNTLLGNARAQTHVMLPVHQRLIQWLEDRHELNRALEFLPSDTEMARRFDHGTGLTSPEFSVLIAYAKLSLKTALADSGLADEPWFERTLADYFPAQIRQQYAGELADHPLRRQIVVNSVANSLVNRGGITFAFRATEETGASAERITRAFVIAREAFGMRDFMAQVEALDTKVSTGAQTALYLEFRRLLDRATRWLLNNRPGRLNVAAEIERFEPIIARLSPQLPQMLLGDEHDRWTADTANYLEQGIPQELAGRTAVLLDSFSLLDIAELATRVEQDPQEVGELYFTLSQLLGIDRMLHAVSNLPREDRWDSLARGAMRDDLYAVIESFTAAVLSTTPAGTPARERLALWQQDHPESVERATGALAAFAEISEPGLAPLSVALRALRGVIRTGSAT